MKYVSIMNTFPAIQVLLIVAAILGGCTGSNAPPAADPLNMMDLRSELPSLDSSEKKMDYRVAEISSGARHILPAFQVLYDDPLQYPVFGGRLSTLLVRDYRQPEALLHHAFMVLGAPAGGWGPPLAGLQEIENEFSFHFTGDNGNAWESLPMNIRALILDAMKGILEAGRITSEFTAPIGRMISEYGLSNGELFREKLMEPWKHRQLVEFGMLDLAGEADLRKLSFASRLMASQLQKLAGMDVQDVGAGFRSCFMETVMGRVGIFGRGNDTITGDWCLVIDLGGDDLYTGTMASPSGMDRPFALVADLGGDDTYDSGEGSLVNACMGIGMLMDVSGHDHYLSGKEGMVSACYGTALLFDMEGDDLYSCDGGYSLGAAHVGAGILADLTGDDRYLSGDCSQGYGGTMGLGLLLDGAGSDLYNSTRHCPSFVQGAARGRWAEATDGHSLGGGLGILVDCGGADEYHAGSFSQGAGYFLGGGFFADLEGNDRYQAESHSQGYAAHFALGAFYDKSGDDRYNEGTDPLKITQILGGGRDCSFGFFLDGAGDDRYHLGNRSMGIGDLNGIGVFWDRDGDDSYTWHKNRVNQGSASMGKTIGPTPGTGTGPRLFDVPSGNRLGIFRDDQGIRMVTEDLPVD